MEVSYINVKVQSFMPCWEFFHELGLENINIQLDSDQDETGEVLLITLAGTSNDKESAFWIKARVRNDAVHADFQVFGQQTISTDDGYEALIQDIRDYMADLLAVAAERKIPEGRRRVTLFGGDPGSEEWKRTVQFFRFFREWHYTDINDALSSFRCSALADMKYRLAAEYADGLTYQDCFLAPFLPVFRNEVIRKICREVQWSDICFDDGHDLCVSLMADSGNWNYDLLCDEPAALEQEEKFEKSSLLWLAKRLGKEQEWRDLTALYQKHSDEALKTCKDPVLKSMLEKMNDFRGPGTVTFTIRLPFYEIIDIFYAQQSEKDRNIFIPKCVCMLVNPVNGRGIGPGLEIETGQDVSIPASDVRIYLRGVLPDSECENTLERLELAMNKRKEKKHG